MHIFLQSLRRRTIKRRFVAFWICFVAIELMCPVLCTKQVYAAENPAEIISYVEERSETVDSVLSIGDLRSSDDETAGCNDECLCHATALPSVVSDVNCDTNRKDTLSVSFVSPICSSLPPPYLPPKFS